MYIIKRYNKRFNTKLFDSYEKARSYVRKWLRVKANPLMSNPAISNYGFSVVKKDLAKAI